MTYREQLYNNIYRVKVPEIALMSEAEMKIYGIPLQYDLVKERVNKRDEDLLTVEINIGRMLEIYRKGAPIYVVNSEDVYTIHNILRNYIAEALDYNHTLGSVPIPYSELREYEQFADEILNLNRPTVIKPDIITHRRGVNLLGGSYGTPTTKEEWDRVKINKPTIPDEFDIPDLGDY